MFLPSSSDYKKIFVKYGILNSKCLKEGEEDMQMMMLGKLYPIKLQNTLLANLKLSKVMTSNTPNVNGTTI